MTATTSDTRIDCFYPYAISYKRRYDLKLQSLISLNVEHMLGISAKVYLNTGNEVFGLAVVELADQVMA
jgi:hypothetical protein